MLRTLIYILMSSIAFIFWGLSFKESLKKGVSSVRFYSRWHRHNDPIIFAYRKTEPVRFYFFMTWDAILSLFFMWLTFGVIIEVLSSFF